MVFAGVDQGRVGDGTSDDRTSPVRIGDGNDWSALSSSGAHTCGLRGAALYCWGVGGRFGGGGASEVAPIAIDGTWSEVDAGGLHTCGRREGALWCAGENGSGEVGDGTIDARPVMVQIGVATDWTEVATGAAHSCGRRGGALYCWGSSDALRTSDDQPSPLAIANVDWAAVSAGGAHTCALRGQRLYCWGDNSAGQLGDGTINARAVPTLVSDWPR